MSNGDRTPPAGYDVSRENMLDFDVDKQLLEVVETDAKNFILTTVDEVFNWARLSSIWPVTFGLACCAIGGGPYFKYGYHVVKGVDFMVPVDVYVPGCPPRPEVLLEGLMRLQDKIRGRRGKFVTPKWITDYAKKIPYRK